MHVMKTVRLRWFLSVLAAVPGSRSALCGIGVATAGTLDTANGVVT